MANTYSQIYIQIVFTVKGRESLILENNRQELQKYMSGIIAERKQKLLAIYCMPDHTHLLISINPKIALSDLVRDIKAGSSKFINDKKWIKGRFSWQEGFGAFSYAQSQLPAVTNYILNQQKHHKTQSFRDEYHDFLKKFEVEYKEEYLFEWVTTNQNRI